MIIYRERRASLALQAATRRYDRQRARDGGRYGWIVRVACFFGYTVGEAVPSAMLNGYRNSEAGALGSRRKGRSPL